VRVLMWAVRRHLRIREAKPEEAALLSALAQSSKAHWGYSSELLERWRLDLTIAPADISKNPTYLADTPTGIAGFYQLRSGPTFWTLEHLWVRPTDLGQGIGSKLLHHALTLALRSDQHRVIASADPHAAGFYERKGGVRCGAALAPIPDEPTRVLPTFEFRSRAA
jgi:GNAT superfamily N-acetyltransferase